MFKTIALAMLVLFTGLADSVPAQDVDQRTRDLIASLDKTKYKKKKKTNVSVEVFVDVKNEPVVKDASEYGGIYEADGYRLELNVDKAGTASGRGYDTYAGDDQPVSFTLEDATIERALLTGTKIYASGESVPFEAVFVNRTSRSGKSPKDVTENETRFGLGFLQNSVRVAERDRTTDTKPSDNDTGWTSRVFLEKQ
jgi:hypothetical protein